VRISRSTTIWPSNKAQVKKDEDEGGDQNPQEIEPFEDEAVPKFGFNEMCDLNNWLHSERGVLTEGRVVHMEVEPEEESGEDKEVLMKRIVSNDPFEIRLKSINQDKLTGLDKCWVLRKIGCGTHYAHQYKEGTLVHNTIVNIRSLVWPGMNHVCKVSYNLFKYYNRTVESLAYMLVMGLNTQIASFSQNSLITFKASQ